MLLLDTCTLLWLGSAKEMLSDRAKRLLASHPGAIHVSAISAFEIGVKHRKRALVLPIDPEDWYARALEFHGVREIPVTGIIAARSTRLPMFHADPCDRIILATAEIASLTVLSPDPLLRAYPDSRVEW